MGKEIQYLNNDPKLTQEMEGIINIIHDNLLNDVYVSISINKNQRKLAALRCLNFSKRIYQRIVRNQHSGILQSYEKTN